VKEAFILKFHKRNSILAVLLILPLMALFIAGCTASSSQETMAMNDLPENIRSAPAIVRQSYQFATAKPELMKQIPCYCGCVDLGHTSNYACYISGEDANGKITYDEHALGCSICVDITQDVVRLSKLSKSASEIKAYIDLNYSQYGPANIP
jgi:Protein of unknown function with PCYCGC motif